MLGDIPISLHFGIKIRVWHILLQEVDIFCQKMKAWSREMLYNYHDDHVVYPLTATYKSFYPFYSILLTKWQITIVL